MIAGPRRLGTETINKRHQRFKYLALSILAHLRRPARLSGVELDAVDVVSLNDTPDPVGPPPGSLRVGEVYVARHRPVVVPPGRVGAAFFIQD